MSRPNAQVKWYKNRKEVVPNKKYHLISQDIYRQLVIEDVCSSDEDTYTCDAGDDSTSCQLLVEGENSAITMSRRVAHYLRHNMTDACCVYTCL